MPVKEKATVLALGLLILGAVVYLVVFVPMGTLGSADGQSYEVDRFSIIGFITFCLVAGYLFILRRGAKEATVEKHDAKAKDGVWPPPPTGP